MYVIKRTVKIGWNLWIKKKKIWNLLIKNERNRRIKKIKRDDFGEYWKSLRRSLNTIKNLNVTIIRKIRKIKIKW